MQGNFFHLISDRTLQVEGKFSLSGFDSLNYTAKTAGSVHEMLWKPCLGFDVHQFQSQTVVSAPVAYTSQNLCKGKAVGLVVQKMEFKIPQVPSSPN